MVVRIKIEHVCESLRTVLGTHRGTDSFWRQNSGLYPLSLSLEALDWAGQEGVGGDIGVVVFVPTGFVILSTSFLAPYSSLGR